jgi:hypothetical protein
VESTWSLCGLHWDSMDFTWSLCGVYWDSMESTWSLHGSMGECQIQNSINYLEVVTGSLGFDIIIKLNYFILVAQGNDRPDPYNFPYMGLAELWCSAYDKRKAGITHILKSR